MRNIAAITPGKNVPSRRYRIDALKPYCRNHGINIEEYCPKISGYPPRNKIIRPAWLIAALAERLPHALCLRGYDAVILQRELISTLPTIESLIPGSKILDIDDAIYLNRGGRAAKHVARCSIGVVCGNSHLADRFSHWNSNVSIIPTGVDTERLKPLASKGCSGSAVIGWIGTSANLKYLDDVADSVKDALITVPGTEFHVISDSDKQIPAVLRSMTRFTRWHPDVEVSALPRWDIGLMPLRDGEWERGKCSFKLLQYMAAGVAVIASPVGMNADIFKQMDVGYGATSEAEWTEALVTLLRALPTARRLGVNGRRLVEQRFSLDTVAERWASVLDHWL